MSTASKSNRRPGFAQPKRTGSGSLLRDINKGIEYFWAKRGGRPNMNAEVFGNIPTQKRSSKQ